MLRNIKRYSFVFVLVALLALTACTKNSDSTTTTAQTTTTTTANPDVQKLAEAKASLILGDTTQVKSNLDLPTEGRYGTQITWSSDTPSVVATDGTVTRPENGSGNAHVVLTATLTLNGLTDTKTFNVKVVEDVVKVGNTVAGILEQAKGTVVHLTSGIVTAVAAKGFYVQDDTGAIYAYTSSAPTVSVGDKVTLDAPLDIYYDEPELSKPTKIDIISSGNALPAPVTDVTVSDIAGYASDKVTNYAQYMTLTAYVTMDGDKVYLQDPTDNTKKVRVLTDPTEVSAFAGKKVNINVVLDSYHSTDKEWRVFFVNNGTDDITEAVMTQQEKLDAAKNALNLPTATISDLTLPATDVSTEVTITWASDNTAVIGNDGKVTVSAANTSATLTATLTIDDGSGNTLTATYTKEVTVVGTDVSTITTILDGDSNSWYTIEGVVYATDGNGYFINDGTDSIYVYSSDDVTVGNNVKLVGELKVYNDQPEFTGILSSSDATGTYTAPTATTTAFSDLTDGTNAHDYGKVITITGFVKLVGQYNDVVLYDYQTGDSILVYYKSTSDFINPIKDLEGNFVTVNLVLRNYSDGQWAADAFDANAAEATAPTNAELVAAAKDLLTLPSSTYEDITLPTTDITGLVTITWASDNTDVIGNDGTVTIPGADTDVTMTATLTAGDQTDTLTQTVSVQGVETIATAITNNDTSNPVIVQGVVFGLTTKGYFINDGTDSIYVYVGDTPTVSLGDNVLLVGDYSTYSKAPEISNITVSGTALDTFTAPTASYTSLADVVALDPTNANVFGQIATITGVVNEQGSYDDVYVTDNNGNEIKIHYTSNADAVDTFVGQEVTLDVVLYQYSGGWVAAFVGEATDITANTLDDAATLAYAKGALTIDNSDNITADFTLPTTTPSLGGLLDNASVSWVLTSGDAVTLDGNDVTVTRPAVGEADANVTLTATITLNSETVTKEITLTIPAQEETNNTPDLFFSEYIEGSSNNKALEIYNPTGQSVDLSEYTVELYTNGSTTPSTYNKPITLSGNLDAGSVYVIVNPSASDTLKGLADLTNGITSFNGDDVIILKHNGTVVDSIGKLGEDPGSAWTNADKSVSTANMTLVRDSSVTIGDRDTSDNFDPSVQWTAYPSDTFDYLGSHTMDQSN